MQIGLLWLNRPENIATIRQVPSAIPPDNVGILPSPSCRLSLFSSTYPDAVSCRSERVVA